MRLGNTPRPPSTKQKHRDELFVARWNTMPMFETLCREFNLKSPKCCMNTANRLRKQGYKLRARSLASYTSRVRQSKAKGSSQSFKSALVGMVFSDKIAPVTLYDGAGNVIGSMDPLTRERTYTDPSRENSFRKPLSLKTKGRQRIAPNAHPGSGRSVWTRSAATQAGPAEAGSQETKSPRSRSKSRGDLLVKAQHRPRHNPSYLVLLEPLVPDVATPGESPE
jgi:hypothetical protein